MAMWGYGRAALKRELSLSRLSGRVSLSLSIDMIPVVMVEAASRRPAVSNESSERPFRFAVAHASFGVKILSKVYGNLKTAAEEAEPKIDWVPRSACFRLLKGT
jgi:hypothetical protein